MDKDTLKKMLIEILAEGLEISVDVWEFDGQHRVKVSVEMDGVVLAEQEDIGW
jgi:hypothetical protein